MTDLTFLGYEDRLDQMLLLMDYLDGIKFRIKKLELSQSEDAMESMFLDYTVDGRNLFIEIGYSDINEHRNEMVVVYFGDKILVSGDYNEHTVMSGGVFDTYKIKFQTETEVIEYLGIDEYIYLNMHR